MWLSTFISKNLNILNLINLYCDCSAYLATLKMVTLKLIQASNVKACIFMKWLTSATPDLPYLSNLHNEVF